MIHNPNTGTDFDDRSDVGLRISLDWDISDTTDLNSHILDKKVMIIDHKKRYLFVLRSILWLLAL
ncbi:MAG: hypothetical protein CM15mP126_2100 [Gammaproteobacteria bacterium]|nr:MAG: hypothetical protein CM15mP126_2100 [Gammaproteobacteria bacterium]